MPYKLTFYRDSTAVSQNLNQQPSFYTCFISYTTNTYVTSLGNSKRIRMKYPEHFEFLDIGYNCFLLQEGTTMELIRSMFLLKLDVFLFFRGAGRKICDVIFEGGLTFCDDVLRGD